MDNAIELCKETGCLTVDCPHCRRRRSRYVSRAEQERTVPLTFKAWLKKSKAKASLAENVQTNLHSQEWQCLEASGTAFAKARLKDLSGPARYSVRRLPSRTGSRKWHNPYHSAYRRPCFETAPFYDGQGLSGPSMSLPSEFELATPGHRLACFAHTLGFRLYCFYLTAVERFKTLGLVSALSGVGFRGIRQVRVRKSPSDLEAQR
jgi:hypothetical protein